MTQFHGQIWNGQSFVPARVQWDQHVTVVERCDSAPEHYLFPAPIDLHLHGGGGHDVMEGDEAIRSVAQAHRQFGLGGFLATTISATDTDIERTLASVKRVMTTQGPDEAVLLGVHLEGPFISPDKLGAHPPLDRPIDLAKLTGWFETGVVKVLTVAPEQAEQATLMPLADQYGVRIQIGHSACGWHQAKQWLEQGAGVTHIFNAMSGTHHRDTGLAGAALAFADSAEAIADGVHLSQAAFASAHRAIPQLHCVSDATAAAGMPDGGYRLGGLQVIKSGSRVELADGTLAGSALHTQGCIQQLTEWGYSVPQIAQLISIRPAEWLKRADWGVIEVGARPNWMNITDGQARLITR